MESSTSTALAASRIGVTFLEISGRPYVTISFNGAAIKFRCKHGLPEDGEQHRMRVFLNERRDSYFTERDATVIAVDQEVVINDLLANGFLL